MIDEHAVIGSVLVFGARITAACYAAGLEAEHFADPRAAAVWSIVRSLENPTIAHVEAEISRRGQSRLVDLEWLTRTTDHAQTLAHKLVPGIRTRSEREQIRLAAREIAEAAAADDADPDALRELALDRIATSSSKSFALTSPVEAAEDFAHMIRRTARADHRWRPVPTGLPALDSLLGGGLGDPMEHEYVVLGARPGMGKTAFVISLLTHTSLPKPAHAGLPSDQRPPLIPALFHSLEQSHSGVMMRAASALFGSKRERVIGRNSQAEDVAGALNLADIWLNGAITLGLDSGVTPERVYSESMRWWEREHKRGAVRGLVVVDYIEHMLGSKSDREVRHSITQASLKMLRMAKRSGGALIPIIISQLNRSVESRVNKRPILKDLREAGALEEHATRVLFLYRQAYYMRQDGREVPPEIECAGEIGVAKARNSPTGIAVEGFHGPRTQWRPLDDAARRAYHKRIGS